MISYLSLPLLYGPYFTAKIIDFKDGAAVYTKEDYKTLEGKSVEVEQFQSADTARPIIEKALQRYSEQRRRGFGPAH